MLPRQPLRLTQNDIVESLFWVSGSLQLVLG